MRGILLFHLFSVSVYMIILFAKIQTTLCVDTMIYSFIQITICDPQLSVNKCHLKWWLCYTQLDTHTHTQLNSFDYT